MTKQNARNNTFLRNVKQQFSVTIYRHTLKLMNSEGQDAAEQYILRFTSQRNIDAMAGRIILMGSAQPQPDPTPDKPTSASAQLDAPSTEPGDYDLPDADDDILKPTDKVEIIPLFSKWWGVTTGVIVDFDGDHKYPYGVKYQINGEWGKRYYCFDELVKIHAA